ncbi:MAG: hypothetical protein WA687_05075 [Solirubrobacterales bacterium]
MQNLKSKKLTIAFTVLALGAWALSLSTSKAAPHHVRGSAARETLQMDIASATRGRSIERPCGKKAVFRRPFTVRVMGVRTPCSEVKRIIASGCQVRIGQKWSCLSLRESKPFIFWFLSDQIFEPRLTVGILLERYPCSEAHITSSLFAHHSKSFPSRRQMLADDLIRCNMLSGMSPQEVEDVIGPPDEQLDERGHIYFDYLVGPERESIVQLDPEFLSVEIANGKVKEVSFFEG